MHVHIKSFQRVVSDIYPQQLGLVGLDTHTHTNILVSESKYQKTLVVICINVLVANLY